MIASLELSCSSTPFHEPDMCYSERPSRTRDELRPVRTYRGGGSRSHPQKRDFRDVTGLPHPYPTGWGMDGWGSERV